MSEHPITPPPKLIRKWNGEAATAPMADQRYIATQASRWGADQELEACCEWVHGWYGDGSQEVVGNLYTARRPQAPPPADGEVAELILRVQRLEAMRETEKAALLDAFKQIDDLKHRIDFHYMKIHRLEDALPLPEVDQMTWQPIDTAPRDGAEILASDYDAIEIVSWVGPRLDVGITGEWTNREGEAMYPAWWQPLPDHPSLPGQEVGE